MMRLSEVLQTKEFWSCLDFKPGDKIIHFWEGKLYEDEILEVSHFKGRVWLKSGASRWIERVQRIES